MPITTTRGSSVGLAFNWRYMGQHMRRSNYPIVSASLLATLLWGVCLLGGRAQGEELDSPFPDARDTATAFSFPSSARSAEQLQPLALDRIVKQVLGATAVVLTGCVVTILVVKRFQRVVPAPNSDRSFGVEASLNLPNRSQIQIVRVDEHRLVVGVDAGGIKSVFVLPPSFAHTLEQSEVELNNQVPRVKSATADVRDARDYRQDLEFRAWKPLQPTI
ncbi:MAG: flagellar biosynthetic protein FliO [Planctomycetales bacterium]|nr:flagellar biosynthetic protein FliO [Planctomycetales bacterium]